ncbi:MAG: ABC transporter substrate-binding protein [Alphaproteobacteria bacterium]
MGMSWLSRHWIAGAVATAASVLLVAPAGAQDDTFVVPDAMTTVPESADPIKLPLWEWTGHHIAQRITGELLKKMGYNVEYVHTAEIPSVPAIQEGSLHASMEYWVGNNRVKFFKATQEGGGAQDLGYLGLAPRETWYYPSYLEEQCPGLPDYKALNDCKDLFATAETLPQGRFLDYPAEWVINNDKRIAALGLDFALVRSGGEGSIITELDSAYARQAPIVFQFWSPHWVFSKYDLKIVSLPPWEPACEEDPAWGPNPDATFDCDVPVQEIKKLVWAGVKDKWPGAYRLLRNVQITNDIQNSLVLQVDVEGKDIDEVVKTWIDENENIWRWWIKDALMNPGA